MKKVMLAVVFLFGLSSAVFAEENLLKKIDPETKILCNKIMVNIYKDILKAKSTYKHLKNFDEKVLYENKYGIYTIIYKYEPEEGEDKRLANYEFGVTIDGLEDVSFPNKRNSFNLAFPLLGLKFSGHQIRHLMRSQYDVMGSINQNGKLLADYQQKFMPLQLTIRTLKDVYKVREDIQFDVTLQNVTTRHMYVKTLGMNTLYFLFEDMVWGTSPNSKEKGGKTVILKAGESLTLKFKGESFQKPRDIEIYCAYRMSIEGVNPAGRLKVKVVDDPLNPAATTPQRGVR